MKSVHLGMMALGCVAAMSSSERYYAQQDRPKPRINPKAPPCNHEMHIKAADVKGRGKLKSFVRFKNVKRSKPEQKCKRLVFR